MQGTTDALTMWMPLTACSREMGTLALAAGSNRDGVRDYLVRPGSRVLSCRDDDLLNPATGLPEQAATVAGLLVDHCRDALDDAGDTDAVTEMLSALLARGNGAAFQRAAFRHSGRLADVVNSAVAATGSDRWVG